MVKGFTFVASWGVLDLRWHGKEYSESEASRTAKSVHKGSPWHKLKGLLETNAGQEIVGPNEFAQRSRTLRAGPPANRFRGDS